MADAAWLGEELLQAASGGHAARLGAALDQGADIEWRDTAFYNRTALMYASLCGHVECVRLLLERGAEVNAVQLPGQMTALMLASARGHLAVVKLLEAAGADIHHKNINGYNALMCAAVYNHLPVCLFLLSKGADLMAASNNNWTALTLYGEDLDDPLSPATLAKRRTALEEAWRAGPHPSQVQRRRREAAWDRRKSLMQVSAENGYRPLLHRLLAEKAAVDPADPIAPVALNTPAKRHAYLLGQVLSNEGIHRTIISMI